MPEHMPRQTFNSNKKRMSRIHFIFIAAITVFLYFEIMTQVWFVKLLGGYLVKVWVPPLLLFIYVLIKKLVRNENLLEISFLNVMLVSYALFGLTSMFLKEETFHLAIKYYLIMIAPVWFYAVMINQFRNNRDIELMIKVLLVCCFISSLYVYFLGAKYSSVASGETIEEVKTSAGNILVLNKGALFGSKEAEVQKVTTAGYEQGKYCGMLAPVILFGLLFFLRARRKSKYLFLAMSGFMLIQVVLTISRAGIASTFIGIVFLTALIYIHEKSERTKIILLSTSALILITIILASRYEMNLILVRFAEILSNLGIKQVNHFLDILGFSSMIKGSSYLDPHLYSIGRSLEAFYAQPLFGNGYTFATFEINEHNRYFFILVSSGLLTFIPYFFFLGGLTLFIRKAVRQLKHFKLPGINYSYLFYACAVMFLVKLLNEGMETMYYWIWFALAMAWIRNSRRDLHTSGELIRK